MNRSTRAAVAVAAAFLLPGQAVRPAAAQSDTLLDLRSTAVGAAGVRLVVHSAGGLMARGTIGPGTIPARGAGTRLALRADVAELRALLEASLATSQRAPSPGALTPPPARAGTTRNDP
jgi:hypothetical protein